MISTCATAQTVTFDRIFTGKSVAKAKALIFGATILLASTGFAAGVQAATFSLSSGGVASSLSSNFNPSYLPTHNPDNIHGNGGSPTGITIFDSSHSGGLKVSGADANTIVTYTYLGSEADYTNLFMVNATTVFQTKNTVSPVGIETPGGTTSSAFGTGNGFLSFLFRSVTPGNKDAVNGGSISSYVALAIKIINPTTAYLFFEDIAKNGDHDFDDMVVRVTLSERENVPAPGQTPVPGAVWLFGSTLAGAAGLRRWRRGVVTPRA
jgi:hypothetical protein